MIGKQVSHYKILEKLGEGGMGVVYKAEDIKLQRTVAIKFLPPELTRDPEAKERFIHEARAASALDHNNICIIHEIDESGEGQTFMVMACYDGKPLDEKIERGPLKIEDVINITSQIAQGLNKAHEKGIVHRDIKLANILVTEDGVVKILDFGLAKLKGKTKLTKEGTTLGTVAYMSPEQARGDEVDHRSDIWSLGVVLYEMITGTTPFRGDYEQAVMYAILNEQPEPVTGIRTGVPQELERITLKCLQKDPGERYQTVSDLLADFRHFERVSSIQTISPQMIISSPSKKSRISIAAGITALVLVFLIAFVLLIRQFISTDQRVIPERKMLVVLPFKNLGPPEDEYFADGITEEITSRLAALHGLGVISRTSAFYYKDTKKKVKQIGEELNVDYILEGTVRWERVKDGPSRVRVTPQLIRVSDDTHLWTQRYDEHIEHIFAVQSTIAEEVVTELNITLIEPEKQAIIAVPTENLEAYQAYLRAMSYWGQPGYDRERYNLAIEMFEKAVKLDSTFVLSYVELVSVHGMLYYFLDPTEERLAQAKIALDRAVALKPDMPQVRLAKGYFHYACFKEYGVALQEFHAAEKDLPNNFEIQEAIGYIYRRQGKIDKAVTRLKRALELDPQSAHIHFQLGETYGALRAYDMTDQHLTRAIALAPDSRQLYEMKATFSQKRMGNTYEARSVLAEAPESNKSIDWIELDLYDRKFNDALDRIFSIPLETIETPWEQALFLLYKGLCYHGLSQPDSSRAAFDEARILLENRLKEVPKSYICHSLLGFALCRLDRKEDAIREGNIAVELTSDDLYFGPTFLKYLSFIYAWLDEDEKAMDILERLMEICYYEAISVWDMKKSMLWDPLRDNPRFQRLIEKYSEEES